MAYSSYNEYIVLRNGTVILVLLAVNYIAFNFNIKPITYILDMNIIKALEFLLSLICLYNIWSVLKGFVLPHIEKAKIPYRKYLFAPGPATLALWNLLRFLFLEVLLGKKPLETAKSSTPATDEKPKNKQLFLNFLGYDNKPSTSTTNTGDSTSATFTTATQINSSMLSNALGNSTAPKESSTTNALNYFLTKDATTNKLAVYGNPNDSLTGTIPKLRFNSCIKPPLEPSAHRVRTLWYLNRTPEVVDDFRIEQILAFRKNWNKFNDRLSSTYYDKMTNELHEKIFKPLAKSIDNFTAVLAARQQTIAKCPPATIGLSLVIPGFNNNSEFTISEVVNFITLENYTSEEAKQYVVDRILELSRSNKLAAYRFTPKTAGMPTDSQIIMHVLITYLSIKESRAIPPLVPADADLFKFLLVYFYMTPELDHWRIFK